MDLYDKLAAESQKLREKEAILKTIQQSLREKENDVISNKMNQEVTPRFGNGLNDIILNSLRKNGGFSDLDPNLIFPKRFTADDLR